MQDRNTRFAVAWFAFAITLAAHVGDEAAHDFLSYYNPTVLTIRSRFPFLPLPTFTFREWLSGLIAAVILLMCLTPLASRGVRWIRIVAWPLGILIGVGNGLGHIFTSFYFHRLMPGVLTAPLLIVAGAWLVAKARSPAAAGLPTWRFSREN